MRFYGRKEQIQYLTESLASGGVRMVLEGPVGIGKSGLLSHVHGLLEDRETKFKVFHKISHAAFTHKELVSGIAKQLLVPLSKATFDWKQARRFLHSKSADYSAQLLGAFLMDGVKATVGTHLQATAQALAGIFKDVYTKTHGKALVQTIISEQRQEMLAPLLTIIDLLADSRLEGTIFLTSTENAEGPVQECVFELMRSLPAQWNIIVGVNNEVEEGLPPTKKLRRLVTRQNWQRHVLANVDVDVASLIWSENQKIYIEPERITQLNQQLQGRPRYLRECTLQANPFGAAKLMKTSLATLYIERLQTLDENSRDLILTLAHLPELEPFGFTLLHSISGLSSKMETLKAANALKEAFLLDTGPDSNEHFFFGHRAVAAGIRDSLPAEVGIDLSNSLFAKLETIEIDPDLKRLAEIDLVRFGGEHKLDASHIESVSRVLKEGGAFEKCLVRFEAIIANATQHQLDQLIADAGLGLIDVLYHAGRYRAALEKIDVLNNASLTPQKLGRLKLAKGRLHIRLNEYAEAEIALNEAEGLFGKLDDLPNVVAARKEKNVILRDTERYDEAVKLAEEIVVQLSAISAHSDPKLQLTKAACWRALARSLAFEASRIQEGIDAANKALQIALEVPSLSAQATSLLARAECQRHALHYTDAIADYDQSARIARSIANRDCYLWARLGLSDTFFLAKDYPAAKAALDEIEDYLADATTEHPLESAHYSLSVSALSFVLGNCKDPSLVEREPELYSRLHIKWPAHYLERLRNATGVINPKNF